MSHQHLDLNENLEIRLEEVLKQLVRALVLAEASVSSGHLPMEGHVLVQQALGLAILSLPKSRGNDAGYGTTWTESLWLNWAGRIRPVRQM